MSKAQPPAPTPAVKTITLLEQNKVQNGDPNGTFSINLKTPITLNEGDSINLSKGYIDTSAIDANFIRVESSETTLTLKTGIYMTDTQPNVTDPTVGKPPWGRWSESIANRDRGTTYILQNQSEKTTNTKLNFLLTDNPDTVGGSPINFSVALNVITPDYEPTMYPTFQYIVKGAPDTPDPNTPSNPPAINQPIMQAYMLDGRMNLVTVNGIIEFYYYPAVYVPPGGVIGEHDHTAVFTRWIDSATGDTKGWKAKRNAHYPGAGDAAWTFLSDADGYIYFDDSGLTHFVQMSSCIFPLHNTWEAGAAGSLNYYPAVGISYKDNQGNYQDATKRFDKYPPKPAAYPQPPDWNAGMLELTKKLSQAPASQITAIPANQLPAAFLDKKHGWGPMWSWYKWTDWGDPLDPTNPNRVFPAIEFSVDELPHIAYQNFDAKNVGVDQGFVNPISQYPSFGGTAGKVLIGNQLQAYQLPDLKPVSNPSSTGCSLSPRVYTTTITIPQGDYTYDNLAQTITDKLNLLPSPVKGLSNNPADSTQPLNSAGFLSSYLLQSSYELMQQYDGYNQSDGNTFYPTYPTPWVFSNQDIPARTDPSGNVLAAIPKQTVASEGVQPYWVSEDGTRLFSYNAGYVLPNSGGPGLPHVVGAESFSLVYDDTANRFEILQAHTPFYVDGPNLAASGTPVLGPGAVVMKQMVGYDNTNSLLGDYLTLDSYSGVFITDVQPRSLWMDKLGFNPNMLTHIGDNASSIQNFTQADSDFLNDNALLATKTHKLSLVTGHNKTGYFKGDGSIITKNAHYFEISDGWTENIETNTPVGIIASPLIAASDDQPFYNIEISGINSQDIAGQVYDNSLIQAHVGKYFSQGNFTESNGDGMVYVHRGNPLVIKDLRVRILDTQMNLEPSLGLNSAFILNINTVK